MTLIKSFGKSKSMDLDLLRSKVDEERVLKELAIVNEQQKEKALLQKQYELKKLNSN